jgi:uncharacterized protein YndB with AHSA1/START domain
MSETTQVYRVYIKATAEQIWTAITDPEWTNRYGYTGYTHYDADFAPGSYYKTVPNEEFKAQAAAYGFPCPDPVVDGEVVEADPPKKLVVKWNMLMDPGIAAEGPTQITYEIDTFDSGYCALTLTHELAGAPLTAALVAGNGADPGADGGGGHAWVLSDLKSLLETGTPLAGA